MKTTLTAIRTFLVILLTFCAAQASAQISINPPEPAGGASAWTKICAGLETGSGPFNSYDMTISWAGSLPNSGNEFILELSDANGDFSNPVELARVNDQNNNTSKTFDVNFAIPTDARGNGYKFRARSTDNVSEAESDLAYDVYYMGVTSNLNISELGDGNPPGNICSTTSVTLQVDNIANPETYQYQWYRSSSLLAGETGHTITIDAGESGMYQALVDYGECTFSGNTDSNFVTVTIGAAGSGVNITPPTKTALCAGETETLTVEMPDGSASYEWFKDGTSVGAGTSFVVNGSTAGFEGDYEVEISGSGICTERSPAVTITNADNFTVTRDNPADVVVLPSQPETLSVSTTALTPTYQWYRNNSPISGATNATHDITQAGSYYAAVTQTGGTCASTTKNSDITTAVTPDDFEITIDYDAAYTSCVSTAIGVTVSQINAISNGTPTDVTAQVAGSFSYQWQQDGTAVSGETNQTISLSDTQENGDYRVTGTLGTYSVTSNTLPVQLLTNETLAITSTSTTYCNATDLITISTTTDLSTESFVWELDGTSINTTDASLSANQPGVYRLVIDKGGCPLISNEITISPLDPNLITLDIDGDVIFPEGSSKTVTASGGSAYQWFDSNNNLMSSTDSMTFTTEGSFMLVADVNNCQITRELTAVYLELFNVPNVITPNGDGSNDQWVLPNSYSNKSDVTVIIYDDKGIELVNETAYQNNWPQSSMSFVNQNMVFYYVIKNTTETLKQGTITVIR